MLLCGVAENGGGSTSLPEDVAPFCSLRRTRLGVRVFRVVRVSRRSLGIWLEPHTRLSRSANCSSGGWRRRGVAGC